MRMEHYTKVTGRTASQMDTVERFGRVALSTLASGKTVNMKEKELERGLMEKGMKAITRRVRSTEEVK